VPYEKITHNGKERLRWYPDGAIKVTHKQKLGVAYYYTTARGNIGVVAYVGNAAKNAFHYSYRKQELAAVKVKEFFDGLTQHENRKRAEREKSAAGHTLKVGDIITNSWGYDQTNVDWYQVVQTSKCYVWLQPVSGATAAEDSCGPMSGYSTPAVDTSTPDPDKWTFAVVKDGKVTKHKAVGSNCSMKFGCGSLWDGKPKYESWYA
jgi:hypothetical protein